MINETPETMNVRLEHCFPGRFVYVSFRWDIEISKNIILFPTPLDDYHFIFPYRMRTEKFIRDCEQWRNHVD